MKEKTSSSSGERAASSERRNERQEKQGQLSMGAFTRKAKTVIKVTATIRHVRWSKLAKTAAQGQQGKLAGKARPQRHQQEGPGPTSQRTTAPTLIKKTQHRKREEPVKGQL